MAQVTYRGVVYDTDDTNDRKDSVQSASQLTYRGIASAIFLTIITAEVQFLYGK